MPKEYGTPGPRAIYPDIATSRSIAALSIEAQLLFDRLVAQADDQGRIEGDAAVVRSLCVPLIERLNTRAVERLLGDLEAEELVIRYQAGRSTLVQLVTWWRWQQGQRRAYPSRWPSPSGWTDPVYGLGGETAVSYKAWLHAAPSGTAPHNAAWRGEMPHNAALTRARLPAAPAAAALTGALTVPDSPDPAERGSMGTARANGTNPRARGTNPRAVAGRDAAGRRDRTNRRHLAYLRGELSETQLEDMNSRDAPLDEIEPQPPSVGAPDWLDPEEPADAPEAES